MEELILSGFSESDHIRIDDHLTRLLSHVGRGEFALCGGVAVRHYTALHKIVYPKRDVNDIDSIVPNLLSIDKSIREDFWIYHYHPQEIYMAMVDPISRIKIDVFSYGSSLPGQFSRVSFHGQEIFLVGLESQLVKNVFDLQCILKKEKVDPKRFFDTRLLLGIADIDRAQRIWEESGFVHYPSNMLDALEKAERFSKEYPDLLQEKPFKKPGPYLCSGCRSTKEFPLTPMGKIYQVLGMIE